VQAINRSAGRLRINRLAALCRWYRFHHHFFNWLC